jgi:acyl carrier protein
MANTTFETLKRALVDNLSVDAKIVTEDASLQDDLGADSLDAVELIMAIEDEFDLEIDARQAGSIETVGDLIKLVDSLNSLKA